MAGLFDGIKDEQDYRQRCKLSEIAAKLDKEDRAGLWAVFHDPDVRGSQIAKRLSSAGYSIDAQTVNRCRRRDDAHQHE